MNYTNGWHSMAWRWSTSLAICSFCGLAVFYSFTRAQMFAMACMMCRIEWIVRRYRQNGRQLNIFFSVQVNFYAFMFLFILFELIHEFSTNQPKTNTFQGVNFFVFDLLSRDFLPFFRFHLGQSRTKFSHFQSIVQR